MTAAERPANRLATETSPYLLQHAHNPVDWYAWGPAALERSRAEDKPILLSIGYSACHWCHVMERESFEDDATARDMNELFVNIKVDREERPDLDQIYQLVVQVMGRSGGWPLTVFLTPEQKPFYAGTYFPPKERYGMPSFRTVLRAVHDAYRNKRPDIERSASSIVSAIVEVTTPTKGGGGVPNDVLDACMPKLVRRFDEEHGGFGTRPKFPNTMNLDLLLRHADRHRSDASLRRVRLALDAMRAGGIYDQLGFGFHRYSTDERWLVPHFEKMLYDNALLARLYLETWRKSGDERYASVVREIASYLEREMVSSGGAFFSTQDADSEGEEGKFFSWTPEQIEAVVGPDDARIACACWGVAPGGNFEHGTSVLSVNRPAYAVAAQTGLTEPAVRETIERVRGRLFEAREARIKPFRDEKILGAWNGLAIGALADAGATLGTAPDMLAMATRAMADVRARLFVDGRLLRIAKDERVQGTAFLDDYAELAGASIDLYEATFDARHLDFARALADVALERFWDGERGGFFFAPDDGEKLLCRAKDVYDNAVPSGQSSMTHVLLRLHPLTGVERYRARAEQTLELMIDQAIENPLGFGHLLGAADRYVRGNVEIVLVGDAADPALHALARAARSVYVPNRVIAHVDPRAPRDEVELLRGKTAKDGAATAYVCRDATCSAPVTDVEALRTLLTA
ncbi:MAG: thioredoxin domain-containing protein [Deltaproteobacteria bacterium]|nr:thioredoxin domain-containing protein [Deltaproteobacteria bacterium]